MSDNPFLLPPAGAKPPVEQRVAPDAAPAADPSHYIVVPASVESATHRIARPAQGPAQEPAPRRWALAMPDGTRVSLDGPLLLGRDPAGIPDRPEARLLPVSDPGKTVSKTHALLDPTPEGVRVRELHSTNGVAIDTEEGRRLLTAGGEAVAPSGATILLGSFAIGVAG
jgi:hypothetical protein